MKGLLPDHPLGGQGGDVYVVDTPPFYVRQVVLLNGDIVGSIEPFIKHLREPPWLVRLDSTGGTDNQNPHHVEATKQRSLLTRSRTRRVPSLPLRWRRIR